MILLKETISGRVDRTKMNNKLWITQDNYVHSELGNLVCNQRNDKWLRRLVITTASWYDKRSRCRRPPPTVTAGVLPLQPSPPLSTFSGRTRLDSFLLHNIRHKPSSMCCRRPLLAQPPHPFLDLNLTARIWM